MGKKKAGGKKSGKKSGKKKGKKGKKEPQITWKEALLAYQINLKEKVLEDVRYELRAVEETNIRHKERNERLMEEQKHYLDLLLKQWKEFQKKLAGEKDIEKWEVIEIMKEKWARERREDQEIAELKEYIARKEGEIITRTRERTYWEEYKDKGQNDHSLQIELLKRELVDMQTSFDEMAGHLERALLTSKEDVESHTRETLDKQKDLASEKAMAKMDKHSRQEVFDNDWLRRETEIHRREVEHQLREVEEVERKNIEIMTELFECTVDDLKLSRNFYLTQFEGVENLEMDGILEMDMSNLKICNSDMVHERPPSHLKSIEDKLRKMESPRGDVAPVVMYLPATKKELEEEEEEEDEDDAESDFDGQNDEQDSDEEDPFNHFYQCDTDDFDDYLKLGPLELKLLNVKGQPMPIHKPHTPPPEELAAQELKPDEWPITAHMLKETIKDHPHKVKSELRG